MPQVQSVIQQNQASVIQSTALQTVHVGKTGNIIFLKGSPNSVIQSPGGQQGLQGVQVCWMPSCEVQASENINTFLDIYNSSVEL